METKPVAWQEQGPVNSPDEWVNEFWAQGEVGATASQNSPLRDKKAPRAEPEEDIDEMLDENLTLLRSETARVTKLENQESKRIDLCPLGETENIVTELDQVAQLSEQAQEENSVNPYKAASPPSPSFTASSKRELFDKESFSSLEGEVADWISDAAIMSDPTEDLKSPESQNSQDWPSPFTEPVDIEEDSSSGEMRGDNTTTEGDDVQLHVLPDGFDNSEAEHNLSEAAAAGINSAAHHSASDRCSSDDVYTVSSPPFADESEEEEEVSIDIMSCQQAWTTLDIRGKPFSDSDNISTEQNQTSNSPAVPLTKQQKELMSQSQIELAPRGANQEAAQQVLGQSSSPLSTVAIELSNQGGAASQGFGVVAVRERHSRAGERTEREGGQTGGEPGQKDTGLERNKTVVQQQGRELLKFSKTVQTQQLKTERHIFVSSKHTRMESDSCDDSQSDSGVSADFSPCSTMEGSTTTSTAAVLQETPIEREIRRAIEREHSLRRSRGLPNLPTSPEYVEIPLMKTVLCQPVTERSQGKDREFAGKKMQHEIHKEARREQDLVKLGKVPGFYDKGTVRQVKDRKQLFEAFQTPSDSTLTVSIRGKATSWSSISDNSTLENQEDNSSQASTIGGSCVVRTPTQSPSSDKVERIPRGPSPSEGTACQIIILENNLSVPAQKLYHSKPEAQPITVVDSGSYNNSSTRTEGHGGSKLRRQETEEDVAPRQNPFFKLRPSTNVVKVEKDIWEAQEREKELHRQRLSLYGGQEGAKGVERPVNTEGKLSSSSLNGLAVPDLPGSSSRGGIRPTAARQSVGKLGMWPPAQAEEEKNNPPESPRTPRQKTPLVQRWESGLVNGHNVEDD